VPRFAANLSMLFTELPFLQRFDAAAAAGFAAVEYLWPYAEPAAVLAGLAALPGREHDFRRGVETALEYAQTLDCSKVHVMAGIPDPDVDCRRAHATYLANLRTALDIARGSGVTLLLEPINAYDMPGYFLRTLAQAQHVVDEIADAGLAIQLDWYHAVRTEQDVVAATRRHLPSTAHLQLAGVPGRHEPDVGTVDYPSLFALVDDLGYRGWVGCEYHPLNSTEEGLGWLPWR
jgi:hydroxypyruvate isomerase